MNTKLLKKRIFELSYRNRLSHVGSCLTALPIMMDIYNKMSSGDKFICSAGHSHLAHLVVMEAYGVIKDAEQALLDYGIHCDVRAGCDASTGSLGHGVSIALGMAIADRKNNVYCLMTDGELAEGSCWEAFRIQREQQVDNLQIVVNMNGWSALGKVDTKILRNKIYFMSNAVVENALPIEDDFPYLAGLQGHYHVLTEAEYIHALGVLQ